MAEKDLYLPIKKYLEYKLNLCGYDKVYVEVTGEKNISNIIYEKFEHQFSVLDKRFFPDLIASFKNNARNYSITIEVKDDPLTVRDLFQALSYGKILRSKKSFLISNYSLPDQIRYFLDDRPDLLKYGHGGRLYIGKIEKNEILDGHWFPENPF
ncbi:hypothetical protein [Virgibacillus doumboii]|uniref:hypothetical protein n=1 Tax=Virgibacillus doumboii TaxID=2697503 RepID=UPI0013E09751|nr:hypothetical protein [Virgibacillus doumboii]